MRTTLTIALLLLSIASAPVFSGPVNVNTADADALADALAGVGPKIAAAIIDYRESNGPFGSVEDLLNVKGVGPKVIDRNKEDILVSDDSSQPTNE